MDAVHVQEAHACMCMGSMWEACGKRARMCMGSMRAARARRRLWSLHGLCCAVAHCALWAEVRLGLHGCACLQQGRLSLWVGVVGRASCKLCLAGVSKAQRNACTKDAADHTQLCSIGRIMLPEAEV